MVCGIYKIQNKINGHIYIGQSVDIERRWRRYKLNNDDCTINQAIRKYGFDNFDFSIIEECPREKLNEREIYWIAYYDSYTNGYNDTLGGSHSIPSKLDLSKVKQIEELLINTNLFNTQIAERFGVSENTISAINTGKSWFRDNVSYPIRKTPTTFSQSRDPKIKEQLKKKKEEKRKKQEKQKEYNKNLSTKTDFKVRQISKKPPKEELLQLLKDNNGNFCAVGRKFEVSDNAVRKWCKSYDLPFHTTDYKPPKPEKNHKFNGFKPVALVEQDEIVMTFETCAAAARWLKEIDNTITAQEKNVATAIGRVCNGERKTCYKRKWKYV